MQGRGRALVLPASFHRASLKPDTPKYPNYTCTSCPFVTGILSAGTKCPIVHRAAETTRSNIHVCWTGGPGIGCAPNGPNWTACWSALRRSQTVENAAAGGSAERSVTFPPALGKTKCHFVSSRSPESERAIRGFALLSRRPPPPQRRGRLRALQAARSSSRVLRVTRRDWRHSTQLEKRTQILVPPRPSSATSTGSNTVAPINGAGPEAEPAPAQGQHVPGVGWRHARPASVRHQSQ